MHTVRDVIDMLLDYTADTKVVVETPTGRYDFHVTDDPTDADVAVLTVIDADAESAHNP